MLHVNHVRYSEARLAREHCPNCKKRTFFVSFFQDYYGWDSTCLRCGDSWQGSEMRERPFERGWRERRVKEAKDAYRKWRTLLLQQPRNEGGK